MMSDDRKIITLACGKHPVQLFLSVHCYILAISVFGAFKGYICGSVVEKDLAEVDYGVDHRFLLSVLLTGATEAVIL